MQKDLSQVIYRKLINGHVINKRVMRDGFLQASPLFQELALEVNREHYEHLYEMIGYELKQLDDCFFLNEIGKDEVLSETAMRVQAILLVLLRGITQIPLLSDILLDDAAGLNREHIKTIEDIEEYQQILKAVGLKGSLSREVDNLLVSRYIAYWNPLDKLVLSDGGKALWATMQGL